MIPIDGVLRPDDRQAIASFPDQCAGNVDMAVERKKARPIDRAPKQEA
jgi:hypothetical protein